MRFLITLISTLLCLAIAEDLKCDCGVSSFSPRIKGGQEAVPHAYPWMVSIERADEDGWMGHSCGGVVINDR